MRWIFALAFVLVIGAGSIYILTDGLTVVTAESARRQSVAREPRAIRDAHVVNQAGSTFTLREQLEADGRIAIINFFYTRCVSLCLAQGFVTQRLQRAIEAQGLQGRVRLISISFDARDGATDLKRYARSMQAQAGTWQFWSFSLPPERHALLKQFGITVVPTRFGDFEHNAALHVVTPDAKLAGILNLEEPGLALRLAKTLSAEDASAASGAARLRPARTAIAGRVPAAFVNAESMP